MKNSYRIRMTVLQIVLGALREPPRDLVKRLVDLEVRGKVKTIHTIASRSASILRRRSVSWTNVLPIKPRGKQSANDGVKDYQRNNNNNNNDNDNNRTCPRK